MLTVVLLIVKWLVLQVILALHPVLIYILLLNGKCRRIVSLIFVYVSVSFSPQCINIPVFVYLYISVFIVEKGLKSYVIYVEKLN